MYFGDFCAAPLRETKWRSGYIVNKTVCYANLIEKEQGNEEFHQFPVAEDKNVRMLVFLCYNHHNIIINSSRLEKIFSKVY